MKKIIFMGESGSGKTTLSQWLHNKEQKYHKTQQVYYMDEAIDTPGEFMENKFYYNALVSAAVEAEQIGFVQSVNQTQNYFPPSFSSRFTRPVIGIITKIDLASDRQAVDKAKNLLKLAGAQEIFEVSAVTGEGLSELEGYLFPNRK